MKHRLAMLPFIFVLVLAQVVPGSPCYVKKAAAHQPPTDDYITAFDFNAVVNRYATAHSLDWSVRIWDADNNQLDHTIQVPDFRNSAVWPSSIRQVVFSPTGDRLAICVQGGAPLILIADVATGQILVEIVEVPSVNTIDWSPDGRLLAGIVASSPVARAIGRLGLWDSATGEKLNDYLIGETSPLFLGWHPSEPKVAFTTLGQVVVFDVENWRELYRLPADEIGATSVAWSPVGDVLASVGAEGLVCVWDGDTGDLLREIKSGVFGSEQPRVFWSQDGNLVGATAGNRIEAWVAKSGQQAFSKEMSQQVIGAVLRPDGRLMVAASRGGVITLETPLSQTRRE